jgi:Glycosyltransferase like family 2
VSAVVCIPWRETPSRLPAFKRVRRFWESSGFDVIAGDSDPVRPFNVSAARNNAVRKADTDTVILADADTLVSIDAVHTALGMPEAVVWPFTEYLRVSSTWVDAEDLSAVPVLHRHPRLSVGGVIVCDRAEYWRLGGFDERFLGWGYEDNAFALLARTFSTVGRVPGVVYSFEHQARRVQSSPNRRRWATYRQAKTSRRRLARVAGIEL